MVLFILFFHHMTRTREILVLRKWMLPNFSESVSQLEVCPRGESKLCYSDVRYSDPHCSYTSYFRVNEFLTNNDTRSSYLPKFGWYSMCNCQLWGWLVYFIFFCLHGDSISRPLAPLADEFAHKTTAPHWVG